jgi:malate dehydrogenase (oxaloacetate-decarboxylating)
MFTEKITMNQNNPAIRYHLESRGKIETALKSPLRSAEDLSLAYTPGVAEVCRTIAAEPGTVETLTNRGNTVAIVTDGTAILGLGNIGPSAGLPVMEGKAMLFKKTADVDAVPLCISANGVEDIVRFCKQIEPSFGGINLEDIAAPECFEILERLENELTIPVFHDDQDGTAIVTLAALINASKVRGSDITSLRAVINGSGAAGIAIARLLISKGVEDVVLVDSKGILSLEREDLNGAKREIASRSNPRGLSGNLATALSGADVFIGVSKGNILDRDDIRTMAERPIVFAMANPEPEILPDEATVGEAFIVGTGRSDFPNQINNALVFPGLFRGLLDARAADPSRSVSKVTDSLKLAVANALAETVEPTVECILPAVMDPSVVPTVRAAVLEWNAS